MVASESTVPPVCFLFDNGSLRAASTLSLRRTARQLGLRAGAAVRAVSLLHSNAVDPADLGGEAAQLLEPALADQLAAVPDADLVLLPFFFGPSRAFGEALAARLSRLRRAYPGARLRLGGCLVDPMERDMRVASALADEVRRAAADRALVQPKVILVDHGSPERAVAAVRDHLCGQLASLLGAEAGAVAAASMERREGPAYAFNEPLLSTCLRTPPFDHGDVVVALQFLSPGRHAGPGGDIAALCAAAEKEQPGLRTHLTQPIANDPRVVDVLASRYRRAVETGS